MKYRVFSFMLSFVVFAPPALRGQTPEEKQMRYQVAQQELEKILSDADKLDDPLLRVKIKARAAALLWPQSQDAARSLFMSLWDFIDQQKDKAFDRESARVAVLRQLYPKDRALAAQLLQKLSDKSQEPTAADKAMGRDAESMRLARLAGQLIDSDPSLAARPRTERRAQHAGHAPHCALQSARERSAPG